MCVCVCGGGGGGINFPVSIPSFESFIATQILGEQHHTQNVINLLTKFLCHFCTSCVCMCSTVYMCVSGWVGVGLGGWVGVWVCGCVCMCVCMRSITIENDAKTYAHACLHWAKLVGSDSPLPYYKQIPQD